MPFVGGCLCERMRYEIDRKHLNAMHCHCQMCRKAHGAAFSTHVMLHPDQRVRLRTTKGHPRTTIMPMRRKAPQRQVALLCMVLVANLAAAEGISGNAAHLDATGQFARHFAELEPAWRVTSEEAYAWSKVKSDNLPTLSGSPEWRNYMAFLEGKFAEYGAVDFLRNKWAYERWDTSDEPTDWSLTADGKPVRVASYGAYSGSTGPEGVTAELVFWDHNDPPESVAGKIVVIQPMPHPEPPYSEDYIVNFTFNDYEYATDPWTLKEPFTYVDPSFSFTFDIWYQIVQGIYEEPAKRGAAGVIVVYDMAFDLVKGMYTFPTPEHYDSPTLVLSREDGAKVIAAAKAGKTANLRLESTTETTETYQLIAYLPGKDYGTAADEQIVLVNHTDGMSITQDNGALGLLGIVKYFSHIPQAHRPRTLAIYLDCRHIMPGGERPYTQYTWLNRYPEAREKIVGVIQMEHLGELDHREVDGRVEPTGLAEHSYLWVRNNQQLIDKAIAAIKKHGWTRGMVSAPERLGIRGGLQQLWWGVGEIALRDVSYYGEQGWEEDCEVWHCLDVPAFGFGSFLGYYYTIHSDISRWDVDQHLAQTATMTELTGYLMTADLDDLQAE